MLNVELNWFIPENLKPIKLHTYPSSLSCPIFSHKDKTRIGQEIFSTIEYFENWLQEQSMFDNKIVLELEVNTQGKHFNDTQIRTISIQYYDGNYGLGLGGANKDAAEYYNIVEKPDGTFKLQKQEQHSNSL